MRNRPRSSGVTLIEIMIVLAIIGLIMGVLVGPKVMTAWKDAKVKTAWLSVRDYSQAYTRWHVDNEAECPASLEDLGRYIDKQDAKDPWGTHLVMRCAPGTSFGVASWGPDKIEGTEDDIHSWDERPRIVGAR